MNETESCPAYWNRTGKIWQEHRDVKRTRIARYETEGERLKAEAERGKKECAKIGSARLSDLATAFLKIGNRGIFGR